MKGSKKMLAVFIAVVMAAGCLAGCGKVDSGNADAGTKTTVQAGQETSTVEEAVDVKVNHYKIGIAHYTDNGKGVDALKAFCEGISDTVGVEFVYTTLSTYDEATNLTEIQNLISAGCSGIIMTADMGTASIVKECEAAGVYLAGFLCDYNQSFHTAFDDTFGSEYFLGTVCDGNLDKTHYGRTVAEKIIEGGFKNVGIVRFPAYAYPDQELIANAFIEEIDQYNETAEEKIEVSEPVELNFQPLEDTYFSEHPDMDALFSIAAGAAMVYPVMVSNGKTNVKLFTAGFEGTDDTDNFGSAGNQCYQSTIFSTPEAIVYPLCLLIDKLNGSQYADLPETSERVDCSDMIILSDEDMETVVNHSIYYSADYSKAILKGKDVVNLCASYNPEATYAGLVDTVNHMGISDLK